MLVVGNSEKTAVITERTQNYSVGDCKKVYVFSAITFLIHAEMPTEKMPESIVTNGTQMT